MTVFGASDVDAAARAGVLQVGTGDLITPLARERAAELGVQIVVGTPGAVAALGRDRPPPRRGPGGNGAGGARADGAGAGGAGADRAVPDHMHPYRMHTYGQSADRTAGVEQAAGGPPPPVRPPSGALYRRGAPLPPALRPPGARGPGSGGRVLVVGAGHVGMITAMRLAEADVFGELVLVDVDEGRARGIALDLTHTAALSGFATRVRGTATVADAGPADYVVITAGRPRTPGMSRSDLLATNAAIVGDIAGQVARTSPDAVLLVVTNPLDEMTQHAWRSSGFPAERVLGMAGVLDTARFRALLALTGIERADRISAVALGSHGEEMVLPLSQATVSGRPVAGTVERTELDTVVDRARGSGAEVVGLLGSGSAFLAPGLSAALMVLAMAADSGAVLPAAVLADGSYGIRGVYVGLPVRLGRRGVRGIVEVDLRPDELVALRDAADRIRERVGQLTS